MPIDTTSPLWAVLADHVKILLTLPDPPPEQLVAFSEVAILTTISVLSQRLSEEVGSQIRSAVAPAMQQAARSATTRR
jgi:hypothetical protein